MVLQRARERERGDNVSVRLMGIYIILIIEEKNRAKLLAVQTLQLQPVGFFLKNKK